MEEKYQILVRLEEKHQRLAKDEVPEKDQTLLKISQMSLEEFSRVRQILQTNLSSKMVERRLNMIQGMKKNLRVPMREFSPAQCLLGALSLALEFVVPLEDSGVHHPE